MQVQAVRRQMSTNAKHSIKSQGERIMLNPVLISSNTVKGRNKNLYIFVGLKYENHTFQSFTLNFTLYIYITPK